MEIDNLIQAHPDQTTHLIHTEVRSSAINETSYVMNKENRSPDKETQNPTNSQKSKPSVFIVRDSMIKKVDRYVLTNSLKHHYFEKTKPFSTAINQKCSFCTLEQMICL